MAARSPRDVNRALWLFLDSLNHSPSRNGSRSFRMKSVPFNPEPHECFGLMLDPMGVAEPQTLQPSSASMATLIGNPAPAFDLPCTRFPDPARSRVNLADYGGRWLVLVFYPRDFSLICPTELIGLSQRFDEFAAQNCELLGVSCDSVESHERWIATPRSRGGLGGLSFPLGSDLDGSAARAYGVYQEKDRLAVRGLFIVDPEGLVQYQVVHSLSVGRRSQEVLRVLAGLQSGGLCREDWMTDGPTIDPFQVIRPGSYFSHYQIEAEAGSGTFARVYRAKDLQLDRSVALKVFKPDCPVTPSAALAEARVAAALNHPNLCTIYAVDDSAGVPIISMEYIAGESLSKAFRPGQRSNESLLSIARQIAAGMAAAHAEGIVHGDLKPENVMVTAEGVVKVLDFGLAPPPPGAARPARRDSRPGHRRGWRRSLRHPAIPVTRAGPWRTSDPGQRCLFAGNTLLRAQHRQAGLSGRTHAPGTRTDPLG